MERLVFYAWNLSMAKVELLRTQSKQQQQKSHGRATKGGVSRGVGTRSTTESYRVQLLMHYECEKRQADEQQQQSCLGQDQSREQSKRERKAKGKEEEGKRKSRTSCGTYVA